MILKKIVLTTILAVVACSSVLAQTATPDRGGAVVQGTGTGVGAGTATTTALGGIEGGAVLFAASAVAIVAIANAQHTSGPNGTTK